ncbi:MAG: rhodanese-like domain-containing protein [Vicingaceae bacterium]
MKNLFLLIGLTTLMACNGPAQNTEVKRELFAPAEFKKDMQSKNDYYLIDVRTPAEFNQGHLDNAENLNLMDGSFENAIEKLDRKKPIYVYCAVGGRSNRAANLLEDKGFVHIVDLKGGYTAWKKRMEN